MPSNPQPYLSSRRPRRSRRSPLARRAPLLLMTAGVATAALGGYGLTQASAGAGTAASPAASAAATMPAHGHATTSASGKAGTAMAGMPEMAAMPAMNSMRMPTDKTSLDEMAHVLALVPTSAATAVAVRSGAWTDAATWRGGAVPAAGAKVVIPAKVTVTYATTTAPAVGTIRVDGTLAFDPARRSRLTVETVVVTHTGTLQVGTPAAPATAGVDIVFAGRGAVSDPYKFGRGLVSMGRAVITGRTTTAFLPVASQLARGARTLKLPSAPTGWAVGNAVVVSGTHWRGQGKRQDETRKIAAVSGTTVTLDRALSFDHRSPVADAGAYVANTTRTVTFRSASRKVAERGHVMFMHSDAVAVHGAAFLDLGRTDKTRFADTLGVKITAVRWTTPGKGTNPLGRYALHFHRAGAAAGRAPIDVSDNAIVGSPGWGLVNHSSDVAAKDNVAVDVLGSSFVTEVGDETGSFTHNIAIGSDGITPRSERYPSSFEAHVDTVMHDMWFTGVGFGMRSNAVALAGNVATDQADDGFSWNGWDAADDQVVPRAFVPAALRVTSRPVRLDNLPVLRFSGNVSVANRRGAHLDDVAVFRDGAASLVDGFTAVNSGDVGVLLRYAPGVLRDVRVVNAAPARVGIELGPSGSGTRVEGDFSLQGVTVRGFALGIDNEEAKHTGDANRPADTYAYRTELGGNTKAWSSDDPRYLRLLDAQPAATLSATTAPVKASPYGNAEAALQVRDGLGTQKQVSWTFSADEVRAALKLGYHQDGAGAYVLLAVPIQSRVTGAVAAYRVRVGVVLSEWGAHGPRL